MRLTMNRRPPLTFSFILSRLHTANASSHREQHSANDHLRTREKASIREEGYAELMADSSLAIIKVRRCRTYFSRPVVHEGGSLAGKESASVLSKFSSDGFALGDWRSSVRGSPDFTSALVSVRSGQSVSFNRFQYSYATSALGT